MAKNYAVLVVGRWYAGAETAEQAVAAIAGEVAKRLREHGCTDEFVEAATARIRVERYRDEPDYWVETGLWEDK